MFEVHIIDHTVQILTKHIGRNLSTLLEDRVKQDLDGKCGPSGYIKPGSTKIVSRNEGELVGIHYGKSYQFQLKVKCDVCNPLPGTRVKAIIQAKNKIGILAEAGFFDVLGTLVPIVEIVVVKDTINLQNDNQSIRQII